MATKIRITRGTVRSSPGVRAPLAAPRAVGGFTLLETLITTSVIALLLAILLPTMRSARDQMKAVKCSSNLRSAGLDFRFFAEGLSEHGQGDSERLGRKRFRINDYQDSLYRLDEFWDLGDAPTGTLLSREEPLLCPAGAAQLTKRRGFPCGREAVGPIEDVTVAVNMRLYRPVLRIGNRTLLAPVATTSVRASVLDHPYVPLLIDVDGGLASQRGIEAFYTAPPVSGDDDPYADGRYWMPSFRHRGRTNVAFVGGHVLSSDRPQREAWNWDYQAQVGR